MKPLCYYKAELSFLITRWWMWTVYGWPLYKRCPQCAGTGKYSTDSMDRYGDEPMTCPMCDGKGKIRRKS